MSKINFNEIKVPVNVKKGCSYDITSESGFSYAIKNKKLSNKNTTNLIVSFLDEIYTDFNKDNKDIIVSIGMYSSYKEYYGKVRDTICNYFNDKNITVMQAYKLSERLNIICNSVSDTVFILPTEYYRSDTENFVYNLATNRNNNRHCIYMFISVDCLGLDGRSKIKYYSEAFDRLIP